MSFDLDSLFGMGRRNGDYPWSEGALDLERLACHFASVGDTDSAVGAAAVWQARYGESLGSGDLLLMTLRAGSAHLENLLDLPTSNILVASQRIVDSQSTNCIVSDSVSQVVSYIQACISRFVSRDAGQFGSRDSLLIDFAKYLEGNDLGSISVEILDEIDSGILVSSDRRALLVAKCSLAWQQGLFTDSFQHMETAIVENQLAGLDTDLEILAFYAVSALRAGKTDLLRGRAGIAGTPMDSKSESMHLILKFIAEFDHVFVDSNGKLVPEDFFELDWQEFSSIPTIRSCGSAVLWCEGWAALSRGDNEIAVESFNRLRVRKLSPDGGLAFAELLALEGLAYCAAMQGRYLSAVMSLESALKINEDADIWSDDHYAGNLVAFSAWSAEVSYEPAIDMIVNGRRRVQAGSLGETDVIRALYLAEGDLRFSVGQFEQAFGLYHIVTKIIDENNCRGEFATEVRLKELESWLAGGKILDLDHFSHLIENLKSESESNALLGERWMRLCIEGGVRFAKSIAEAESWILRLSELERGSVKSTVNSLLGRLRMAAYLDQLGAAEAADRLISESEHTGINQVLLERVAVAKHTYSARHFVSRGLFAQAATEFDFAQKAYRDRRGDGHVETVQLLLESAKYSVLAGDVSAGRSKYMSLIADPTFESMLGDSLWREARIELALCHELLGEHSDAARELGNVIDAEKYSSEIDPALQMKTRQSHAWNMELSGDVFGAADAYESILEYSLLFPGILDARTKDNIRHRISCCVADTISMERLQPIFNQKCFDGKNAK